ncbi:MAG: hypothetical protein ACJ74H_10190 [Thermoanaerobaculia bacterium]
MIALCGITLDAETAPRFYRLLLVLALVATGISGFLTASKFSSGDRLLKSWLFIGLGYALSAVRHGTRLAGYFDPAIALPNTVGNVLVIAQNIAIALALLLFVLAWRATGLTAPISRRAQITSTILGIAVAVIVGGFPLVKALTSAEPNPVLLISTAGDIVGLSLIVPLALSALAMRGGLLMHTWVYLAASEAAWLLYDVWWALQPPVASNVSTAVLEAMRLLAVLFAFIATVAQRRAMR